MNILGYEISDLSHLAQFLVCIIPVMGSFILWIHNIYKKVKNLTETVNKIAKEFQPNSGSSLRDVVNGLNQSSLRIEERLASVELAQKVYIDIDSDVPIFQTDVQGRLCWANKAFLQFVELPLHELQGSGWHLMIDQSERHIVREEWEKAVKEERTFEYCFKIVSSKTDKIVKCRAIGHNHGGYIGFFSEIEKERC